MDNMEKERIKDFIRCITGILCIIILYFVKFSQPIKVVIGLVAIGIVGYEVFKECIENFLHCRFFDENTLMAVAALTAFIIGEYLESIAILVLYVLGETLEDIATDNSKEKIAGLSKLKSVSVHLQKENNIEDVSPEKVEIGSEIEIKKGERIAIDGVLMSDECYLDMRAVTGESKTVRKEKGEEVYSGSVNTGNPIRVLTTKKYSDSMVEKIISMVEGASAKKSKTQNFITIFAKIYTPIIVAMGVLIAVLPPFFDGMNFYKWIYKALNFIIVSCPCALVISIPLCYYLGIGVLAKKGILVKGGNYIDALNSINVAVFDKTGTLTKGKFELDKVEIKNGYDEKEFWNKIISVESFSNHPIKEALCKSAKISERFSAEDINEISGKGIYGKVNGKELLIGNSLLMRENGINCNTDLNYSGTVLYVAENGKFIGKIYLTDKIKESGKEIVKELKEQKINLTAMVSGDNKKICEEVGEELGINNVYSELLPQEKVNTIEKLKEKYGKLLYVGDGINDSPSIAVSDVGFAMGKLGSDISVEVADVVIMDDDLGKIPYAIKQSKRVKRKVIENIVCSLVVKFAVMILSITTNIPVWLSTFSDVGVMLIAIINSTLIFYGKD